MKVRLVEMACAINNEIKDLKRYKELQMENLFDVHFELIGKGMPFENEMIKIDTRHNKAFFKVLDTIIEELETELESL